MKRRKLIHSTTCFSSSVFLSDSLWQAPSRIREQILRRKERKQNPRPRLSLCMVNLSDANLSSFHYRSIISLSLSFSLSIHLIIILSLDEPCIVPVYELALLENKTMKRDDSSCYHRQDDLIENGGRNERKNES